MFTSVPRARRAANEGDYPVAQRRLAVAPVQAARAVLEIEAVLTTTAEYPATCKGRDGLAHA